MRIIDTNKNQYEIDEQQLTRLFLFLHNNQERLLPLRERYAALNETSNRMASVEENVSVEVSFFAVVRLAMALYAISGQDYEQFFSNPNVDVQKKLANAYPNQVLSLLSCGGYLPQDIDAEAQLSPELLLDDMQSSGLEDILVFDLKTLQFLSKEYYQDILSSLEGAMSLERASFSMSIEDVIDAVNDGNYNFMFNNDPGPSSFFRGRPQR